MNGEPVPPEILRHYREGREVGRLFGGHGLIERARTQEIVLRHLPAAPSVVLDVGGGGPASTRAGWRPSATRRTSSTRWSARGS